jgi:hypothetical protein
VERRLRPGARPSLCRHVFFVNGVAVGSGEQRPGDALRSYELSRFLRPGRNRLRIHADHPNGAGGILFCLRLPDGSMVVSDKRWRVGRSENELASEGRPAAVWGRPPMYPWGYPR